MTYADDDVLSIAITASFHCGGAHPVNGADSSVTFDLLTGDPVRFRDLFEDHERDSTKIAAAYAATLSAEELEGCEEVLSVERFRFNYTLSPGGLVLQPSLPHVMTACAHRMTVPLERVHRLAAPDGILMRLGDWRPLAEFESVEAFERQLLGEQEQCLAQAGGGSLAATCFKLHELWDRELNLQYRRLRNELDEAGREKLTRSQRDWIAYRDSTHAFTTHMLDFSYSAPGTLWHGIRADVGVATMAAVVRDRTLLLIEWEEQRARGPVDEESLLNESD